jgi:flagellar hook assembly protein FlgD
VTLSIYDVAGRLIRVLVDEVIEAGRHERLWNGKDAHGNPVSSGVYFYRLSVAKGALVRKMMLLR